MRESPLMGDRRFARSSSDTPSIAPRPPAGRPPLHPSRDCYSLLTSFTGPRPPWPAAASPSSRTSSDMPTGCVSVRRKVPVPQRTGLQRRRGQKRPHHHCRQCHGLPRGILYLCTLYNGDVSVTSAAMIEGHFLQDTCRFPFPLQAMKKEESAAVAPKS